MKCGKTPGVDQVTEMLEEGWDGSYVLTSNVCGSKDAVMYQGGWLGDKDCATVQEIEN